ncbi:hypothetical protein RRG08_020722 [Elysia crispata]|uniref:Uncharacterized protein n=1 Tax=Elysia crispata TaxID=231223 RepID=A0AAE0Z2S3_9GAST|nr:hypothetical protein RRG08_020722 [Elysia crispata]
MGRLGGGGPSLSSIRPKSPPNKTPGGGIRDTPKPPFNSYLEFCFESSQPQKAQLLQRVETRVSLEAKYGKVHSKHSGGVRN